VIILRVKDPDRERPFRVPGGNYLLPGIGAASCIFLAFYLPGGSWMRFGIWLAIGLVIYVTYGYKHSRLRRAVSDSEQPVR